MMKVVFASALLVISIALHGQDRVKVDSLLQLYEHTQTDSIRLKALWKLNELYSSNDYAEAIKYAEQALDISLRGKSKQNIARSHALLANDLMFLGYYERSMQHYIDALDMLNEPADNEQMVSIMNNIGTLQDRLRNYDKALEWYFKALNTYNKSLQSSSLEGDRSKIAPLYNNIGNIYYSRNEFNNAGRYYLEGIGIALKYHDDYNAGILYNNLGRLEIQQKNFGKALDYLKKSIEIRTRRNEKPGLAVSYYYLADYYITTHDYIKAEKSAKKSLELGEEVKSLLTMQTAVTFLADIYEKTGRYHEALIYQKLNKTYSDSLINEKTIREITRIQMQYEYSQVENQRKIDEQRKKFRYIVIFSSMVAGLIILGLLFFLAKSRANRMQLIKEKLEVDMDKRNKELTTNVIYLVKKNELINTVIDQLLKLQHDLKDENRKSVQGIIMDLQSGVDKEVWDEFEYRFQQVHTEFYNKLQQRFPDLSPAERKLAAFLRLNMTSKDIAAITGQSIKSLEVARYRLRKKLDIANKDINLITFLSDL